MTDLNPEDLGDLLASVSIIAVVGASTNPDKPGHEIPAVLIEAGYDVVPVNPTVDEVFGRTSYPSLGAMPLRVDVVSVFRPAEEVPDIAEAAVAVGARVLWLQEGIVSEEGRRIAEAGGLRFVEDTCIGATMRLTGARPAATRR